MNNDIRINTRIRAGEVRLISDDGEQLGIKPTREALAIAEEKGLDLVEVAPQATPPVVRIMDYGKYKYEQEQKAKKARKHQTITVVKEIKFRPKIDKHDYETKKKHVERFLNHGDKVKVTVMFRGREMAHTDIGAEILKRLTEDLEGLATVESAPKLDGRNMVMVFSPTNKPKSSDSSAKKGDSE